MSFPVVTSVQLTSLPLIAKGKVREVYQASESTLLLAASDRVSAFDHVLQNGVPDKGAVLTLLTSHWLLTVLPSKIPELKHHLITLTPPPAPQVLTPEERQLVRGRCMVVNKYKVFPVEAIVRGYITGSAWEEYQEKGTVHGIPQPAGLQQCQAFPDGPIYTPSTKAPVGEKDQNLSPEQARQIVGDRYADKIESLAMALYKTGHAYALERGVIIADTKFEFGLDEETDEVVLIDEVLTPDSSRFWPAADYIAGQEQKSFDKQFLRDWLTSQGLRNKDNVAMAEDVVAHTRAKYREVFERLTEQTVDQALMALEE